MSDQEQSAIERMTADIERLLPIGGWVKFLVAGGVAIGAWVTTIQVQAKTSSDLAIESKVQVRDLQGKIDAKFDDLIKTLAETNQRLSRIEGRIENK